MQYVFFIQFYLSLFPSKIYFDRNALEVPMFADLVFEETLVRIYNILREITEECKGRVSYRQLGDVFDTDYLVLVHWWWRVLNDRQQHIVQLGSGNLAGTIVIYLNGGFQYLIYTLFFQHGGEDDGHVVEGSDAALDKIFVLFVGVGVLFDEVPFVHHHHYPLVVAGGQTEDVEVLLFETLCGVGHHDADVGVFDASYGAHYGVELEVFFHLALTAQTGCVDEVEVEAEVAIAGEDGVAGGAGQWGYDVTVFAQEGVDDGGLAHIRFTYDSDARQVIGQVVFVFAEVFHHLVEQLAGATT